MTGTMKHTLCVLFLVIFVGVWQGFVLAQQQESQEDQDQHFGSTSRPCSYRCLQGQPKSKSWASNFNNHDSYSMYQAEQQQVQGQEQNQAAASTWFYYDNFNNKCRAFTYYGHPTQRTLASQNIHYSEASCVRSCEVPCNQREQQLLDEAQQQQGSQGMVNGQVQAQSSAGAVQDNQNEQFNKQGVRHNLKNHGGGCWSGGCWSYCDNGGWCWTGQYSNVNTLCQEDRQCSPHWGCVSYCQ